MVSAVVAVGLLMGLGVCVPAASAEALSMTFTEARANVGAHQLSDAALFGPPDTAPLEAGFDPGSGLIADGILEVPDFSTTITDPIETEVTVVFNIGLITGSFNQASGSLALSGEAGGTLTASGKECVVTTTPSVLTLSTVGSSGGTSPRSGEPFAAGLAGPGAIAGQWTDMQATPVDTGPGGDTYVCEVVEEHIEGPGGIWLKQEGKAVPPPSPPPPSTSTGGGSQAPPPPPPPPAVCTVPKLTGKTLAKAKAALRTANCRVGAVRRPKHAKGKRRPPLVVRSSSPAAGATPADGEVDIRLAPRPHQH